MGVSSLAVMGNSLMLQFEGRSSLPTQIQQTAAGMQHDAESLSRAQGADAMDQQKGQQAVHKQPLLQTQPVQAR